ncbi:MAG: thiamine pyrophosphate-dependent enzyme, partial [Stackebrandtia sp.]
SEYCEQVGAPEQLPRVLRIAAQTALGRGGVSVMVLPGDVAQQPAHGELVEHDFLLRPSAVLPPPEQIDRLSAALNHAQKIMLFCGAGVRDAHAEVMALAHRVLSPVGHALRGKEWIQFDNPYDVGMSGLLGYGACYEAMREADLVVLVGTDFPYDQLLPGRRTIQIDHDATRLGRRTALELAVHGDIATTLRSVMDNVAQKTDTEYLHRMLREHAKRLENVVHAYTRNVDKHIPIHPEYAASLLDELADDAAVFTVDTGMCCVWAARYITPNPTRRMIGSFVHGSMANALPHAIGVQLAEPDRQVIVMAGDGGLGMLLGELLTVRLHDLPVKIIVFNNASLGMVKLEMLVDGMPDYETDHRQVDYAAIADGAGIPAERVTDPAEVRAALSRALTTPGPYLVDVVTDPNALSVPPRITAGEVKGFALAAGKIVLNGGVGKMIDMARSNLRNIPRPLRLCTAVRNRVRPRRSHAV